MSKYYYNKDYFHVINSEEKAYWLGFLYADGCIVTTHKNEKLYDMHLELSLCRDDRQHLKKFLDAIESNIEIKDKVNTCNGKKYLSSRITVCNKKFCYDLIALGCTPRKTYDIKFPSDEIVPYKFKKDFIRGYFDGDGCISITHDNTHIEVTFTGMSDMLKDISDFLISEKIIRVNPKIYKDSRSEANNFFIYGNDNVKEFLDYIYKDSKQYLDRKYNKYIDYYKSYDDKAQKRGVYYDKFIKKYIATISINNHRKRIGTYDNIDDAINARKKAEIDKMNFLNKLPA